MSEQWWWDAMSAMLGVGLGWGNQSISGRVDTRHTDPPVLSFTHTLYPFVDQSKQQAIPIALSLSRTTINLPARQESPNNPHLVRAHQSVNLTADRSIAFARTDILYVSTLPQIVSAALLTGPVPAYKHRK